ncbi:Uncharacterized protein TCAP_00203 [Tolypocladium capitatum]|uniref:Uncharacterized protein n=1 Tax=Tolypocladium capitatum TaxID=45235 RepID=A0A2K3QQT6_9HYPO|nr:Uncharacterized protein TCAP_00203 [Tolypocladium capitatum]
MLPPEPQLRRHYVWPVDREPDREPNAQEALHGSIDTSSTATLRSESDDEATNAASTTSGRLAAAGREYDRIAGLWQDEQRLQTQGYGANRHLVWRNAKSFEGVAPLVELANGGDKMAFYHYGSDREYRNLLANVRNDARLNSLAYASAAVRWRQLNADS